MEKIIAIIPARSGSKGLPDKNIIDLNGHPLIYYTIKAAFDSGLFDEVMVSTDSELYADIAKKCGAKVPFLRSEKTSGDKVGSFDVVREVLSGYKELGREFDYIALLQPTSPLRDKNDIIGTFNMIKKGANNAVSICEVAHPVQWCFTLPEDNCMDEFSKSPYSSMRRQDLEKYYMENGAIYFVDAKKIMSSDYNFYADDCHGYIMSREKSIDIDEKIDLVIAKAYMYENINVSLESV